MKKKPGNIKEQKQLEKENQFSDDVQDNEENFNNINDDPVKLQQTEVENTVKEERPTDTVTEEETLCYVIEEVEQPIDDSSSEESISEIDMSEKRNKKPNLRKFVDPAEISSSSSFYEVSFEENIDEEIKTFIEENNGQWTKSQEAETSLESVSSNNGLSFF